MTRAGRAGPCLALLAATVFAGGCAAPFAVQRVDVRALYREQAKSALSSSEPCELTRMVLRRYGLLDYFKKYPDRTIAALRASVLSGRGGPDELFAMSELSYLRGDEAHSTASYLASALYAYAFLFPEDERERPDPLDPRTRMACDLYSRALTRSFRERDSDPYVVPRGGAFALPFGQVEVAFAPESVDWQGYRLQDFVGVDELQIRGVINRYRDPGIGAPWVARPVALSGNYAVEDLIGPNIRVPVTALLRFERPREQVRATSLSAALELYATDDVGAVKIGDQTIALESEPTAALASAVTASRSWESELTSFLGTETQLKSQPTLLRAMEPYRHGRIPVVLVHGTASSPVRWADMINDLYADQRIRDAFQLWVFTYDSGNPIVYSGYRLRKMLSEFVERVDPGHSDPAMQQMVVIGHSQGGLLTKLTAIDSGDRFWANVSGKPFEAVSMKPETRELLREALFVKPLPFVKRVVFIATPHRGSYLAGPQIVRRLVRRLVRLPSNLVSLGSELSGLGTSGDSYMRFERIPTSIDNMSSGNPFVRAISTIPISPGVKAHSIIPVLGTGPYENGADGVVKYQSAHIEGVESELVVRSGHSTQSNPYTIEEVRRILLLHLAESRAGG